MSFLNQVVESLKNRNYDINLILKVQEYTSKLIDANVPVIYDLKHLSLYLDVSEKKLNAIIENPELSYNKRIIVSKRRKKREIYIPNDQLKYIQKWILENILYKISASKYSKGFTPNKSTYDNALPHINKAYVLNIDFQDFFINISSEQIFNIFSKIGYSDKVSAYLTKLSSYNGILPQGAPSSPYISNLVCLELDNKIGKFISNKDINYTRYADDLSFSSNTDLSLFIEQIESIILEENFKINKNKFRLQKWYERQMVTGLVVNTKVNVPRKYYRQIKQEIFYCKRYGVASHMEKRGYIYSNYKYHLYGKALYIKMINPEKGKKLIEELDEILWQY